ncbi:MAG TPA: OsmC family protein [Steroidobacteraceae bacterium]|nr:OsmC family protein [Steroidobacteraceae bacterium]
MHPFPHTYNAAATANVSGPVTVTSAELPPLETAPPPEFDGPGGVWSPETLLCASLADCFILTFRAVTRVAQLKWIRVNCRVEGVLERVARTSQFTRFKTIAELVVPAGTNVEAARKLLEQAEHGCLIANSLRSTRSLEAQVLVADH